MVNRCPPLCNLGVDGEYRAPKMYIRRPCRMVESSEVDLPVFCERIVSVGGRLMRL